jgi:dimethylaniline monooxygenase (N-oxide forming)
MYAGCVVNSCRDTSGFSDFPIDPERYPDFYHHRLHLKYLNEYADHFGLKEHIRYGVTVIRCLPIEEGKEGTQWRVTVKPEGDEPTEEHIFDAVMCCSGNLSVPDIPNFAGKDTFKGEFKHSHYYREPGPYAGKRVVVIGLGSSAIDIACEVAPHAEELHMVTRRGGWVVPRYLLGKPIEAWDSK